MWFVYRKTPLGTAVRDTYMAIAEFCISQEELTLVREKLSNRVSGEIEILNIEKESDLYELISIDPDIVDVVANCKGKANYIVIVSWIQRSTSRIDLGRTK